MGSFIVRVELHGNGAAQRYESLHAGMAKVGLLRTIRAENGKTYFLPTAEYHGELNYSCAQVLDLVTRTVSSIWTNSSVVVSETASVRFFNLAEKDSNPGNYASLFPLRK